MNSFNKRQESFISSRYKLLTVFVFAVITLFIFNNVGIFHHIGDKPNSVHTWAQSDRASVAACYYNESMNFFKPRVYNRGDGTNSGICGMEFPAINYAAAICYKVFGFHDLYYRLINFILLFTGLISAFLLAELFLKDALFSGIVVWLFMMSPVLFFYSANFLPDTGSLGILLTGWYLFFRLEEKKGALLKIFFTAAITLACLVKVTSLVSVIAMIMLMLGKHFGLIKSAFIPAMNRKMIFGFLLCFVCVAGWYQYAVWLDHKYQNYFFILNWNTVHSVTEFIRELHRIYNTQFHDYYPYFLKWAIAISFLIFLLTLDRHDQLTAITFILLTSGLAVYVLAMLKQFLYHDYYIIPMLPAIFFLFLTTAIYIKSRIKEFRYVYFVIAAGLLLIVNMGMINCKKFYENKRYGKGYEQISYARYDQYTQASQYLDTLGVGKNDLVISYFDQTPNASLYLLNRKGTTVRHGDIGRLNALIFSDHFSYFVLTDTVRLPGELNTRLAGTMIGEKYGLKFYQIRQ